MIGFLSGKLISKTVETSHVVISTESVGYEVTVVKTTFDRLSLDSRYSLWIHTHVREDILQLYGFETEMEKQLFRVLLSVSGLGPRTALSLLSEHGPERLAQFIMNKDTGAISEAQGVGKKLAERIALELASKMEKMAWAIQLQKVATPMASATISGERQLREDLTSALLNLGYPPNQVKGTLDRVLEDELGFEASLKAALKEMSGRAYG